MPINNMGSLFENFFLFFFFSLIREHMKFYNVHKNKAQRIIISHEMFQRREIMKEKKKKLKKQQQQNLFGVG